MENIKSMMNDKKKAIFLFVFIISITVGGIFLYKYINSHKPTNGEYKENTELSVSDNPGSKSATVYFFYTTWCPHSLSAIPEWEKIVEKYTHNDVNGYSIKFIDIDCTKESVEIENMINKYSIDGYPTIKMVKDDQVIEFNAKAKFDNIEKFLSSVL